MCTTTVHRRGAICIIVNNPDDEDSKQYNNLTSCSTDSDYDDNDEDNDDNGCSRDDDDEVDFDMDFHLDLNDDDDDDDTDNDCIYFDTTRDGHTIDYTIVNNNVTNKPLNAHKRKANRKYDKNRKLKMKLKSPSTAVVVGTDVQVHPKQLNFWQNLLVTQKRRQRRPPSSTASNAMTKKRIPPNASNAIAGTRSQRIIDFFRRSSRDIHRKPGEG